MDIKTLIPDFAVPPQIAEIYHEVVVVGGGAAGIAVAASLKARKPDIDVAIIDPADTHYYEPGIYGLGDSRNAPNAKTAAAVRKQAPIVAHNPIKDMDGQTSAAADAMYNGYGYCPLTVERGRVVLAECGHGGKLQPSFPASVIDGTQPSRLAWVLKERFLPPCHWNGMLRGHEWLAEPELAA